MLGINFVPKEHARHWISKYSLFEIAYPSLAKQQEIVSYLDTFTTLISNLESELDMRRKQYEHYRNQLLDITDKDSHDIVPFGDICKIIRGNGVQKADFLEEGVGCIHYGQIYTHYGSYSYTTNRFVSPDVFNKAVKASKGDVIMTDTSENVEDICKSVAYLGDEDIAVSNHTFIIKHNQNPKYLSFCTLTNSFGFQKKKVVFGAKVSAIKQDNLAKIQIYLPSIEEQNKIVEKLDAFRALRAYFFGFIVGKRITSRIVELSVNNITNLSSPIPSPPVGGRPYSSALMKSSSTCASLLTFARFASTCLTIRCF